MSDSTVVRMAEASTFGPLEVIERDLGGVEAFLVPAGGDLSDDIGSLIIDRNDHTPEQMRAWARLFAAAPDLLALCKEMKQWLVPEVTKEPDRTYFWKLVDVIRKAEGRDPLSGRPEVEYPNEASMIRDNGDAP